MTDIRLNTAWPDNLKTRKLLKRLGSDGVLSLVFLWCYAGANCPDGTHPMSPEDLELAARWEGEPGVFVETLVDLRFLDKVEGGFVLHEWALHQPYAVTAPARQERARKAAAARWLQQNEASVEEDAHSMPDVCPEHADSGAPTYLPTSQPSNQPASQPVDSEDAILAPGHEEEEPPQVLGEIEDPKTWLKKAWMDATGNTLTKAQVGELLGLLENGSVTRETLAVGIAETGKASRRVPFRYLTAIIDRMRSSEGTAGKESGNTGPGYHNTDREEMAPAEARFASLPPDDFLEVVGGRGSGTIQEKEPDPWD